MVAIFWKPVPVSASTLPTNQSPRDDQAAKLGAALSDRDVQATYAILTIRLRGQDPYLGDGIFDPRARKNCNCSED